MNLRDLNKDMLIKLIETIQKDKQKKIDELESLLAEITSVRRCNKEGCKAVTIQGNWISKIIVGTEMYTCASCGENMCYDHCYKDLENCLCLHC